MSGRKCPVDCACKRHDPIKSEQRAESLRGKPKSAEHRAKIAENNRRLALDPEWQRKHSEAVNRLANNPQWLENVRNANRLKASDPEWQKRQREAIERRSAPLDAISKVCPVCKVEKSKSDFYKNSGSRDGLQTRCKECKSKSQKENRPKYREQEADYRQKNRGRIRDRLLKKLYGIGSVEYDALMETQGGVCAICGEPETKKHQSGVVKMLAVDHNHETGHVRGLLCGACNLAVGQFRDHPGLLQKAIQYLSRQPI